jgi:hypothetical protein
MSSNFKISGQERRDLKKLLNEYKAYEKGFWHYHQLDKDMCAFITPIRGMQKDTKAYLMSDEEAQKRYDELLTKINKIDEKLEEKMSKCEICGGSGYHKLSCGNNTARVAIPMTMQTAFIPTLEGDEAEEFIRKADENVRLMKQRRCKNHVWRKDYINGGKVCQVCGKAND